jgi:hypothetical protein
MISTDATIAEIEERNIRAAIYISEKLAEKDKSLVFCAAIVMLVFLYLIARP